jgi:hypothetical protein
VVPPRTSCVLSDPTRRLCFEENSAGENINTYINDEHSKKICIDNYSGITSEDDDHRKYVSEYSQGVCLNNSPRKLSTDSHQTVNSDDQCENIVAGKKPRKYSPNNLKKIFNVDDKVKMLSNGEHYRESSSKYMLSQQQTSDEISTKIESNIQRFLADPIAPIVHHKQSCERNGMKSVIAHGLESSQSKLTVASPLDLTKLK